MTGVIGTIGATRFTIFLARIFLPGFLRGLRTTSARDHDQASSVESSRPRRTRSLSPFPDIVLQSSGDLDVGLALLDVLAPVELLLALRENDLNLYQRFLKIKLGRGQR